MMPAASFHAGISLCPRAPPEGSPMLVRTVTVLGGGSAGFLAAIALKAKLPDLAVTLLRSQDIGIIGVGEGSTLPLTYFLHKFLGLGDRAFIDVARPTWKL